MSDDEVTITFRLARQLKSDFLKACIASDFKYSQVLRRVLRLIVEHQRRGGNLDDWLMSKPGMETTDEQDTGDDS